MPQPTAQTKLFVLVLVMFVVVSTISLVVIGFSLLQPGQPNVSLPINTSLTSQTSTSIANTTSYSSEIPSFTSTVVVDNLDRPWDIAFFDANTFIFNQRKGHISLWHNGDVTNLAIPSDIYAQGEGGLLALAVDPEFEKNYFIYTCFNRQANGVIDVRVARWQLNLAAKTLAARQDILTGMPSDKSGRHSGCQLEFGPDGYLWIGTGDAANGTNPQDPKSLGGKILRVDRNGSPVAGNLPEPFDPRIYSYGHRNVQGLAFFKEPLANGIMGISIEQGTDRNDELNPLLPGNFGWDPVPGYNESVAMTDLSKFPGAVKDIWNSGFPTVATSGGTVIYGSQWKAWDGAVAMATLKAEKVLIMRIDASGKLLQQWETWKTFGRVRTVQVAPDGNIYLLTDTGSADKIIKITPK